MKQLGKKLQNLVVKLRKLIKESKCFITISIEKTCFSNYSGKLWGVNDPVRINDWLN